MIQGGAELGPFRSCTMGMMWVECYIVVMHAGCGGDIQTACKACRPRSVGDESWQIEQYIPKTQL